MRTTAVIFLSTLAVAAGFAPGLTGRQATPLFMSDEKKTGTVKWFNSVKGFGFIIPDDDSGDVFVHQTSINTDGFRSLAEGEAVEFTVETDSTGKSKAMDVTGPAGADVQGAP